MRRLACALLLTFASALFAPLAYGQTTHTEVVSMEASSPRFPKPVQAATVGLALTAVAAIGARVANRSSDLMMYLVLGCLAVTAVTTAYADRIHGAYVRAGFERLDYLQSQLSAAHPD